MRNAILLALSLSLTALAFAHPYETNHNSDNYYWAHDYYHSGDYRITSQNTYYTNTYNKGYDYRNQDEYLDSLYRRQHPWLYQDNQNNRYFDNKYNNNNRYSTYDNKPLVPIYHGDNRVFVEVYDYKLEYSKTMNKEYLSKCYTHPPTKNTILYVKC